MNGRAITSSEARDYFDDQAWGWTQRYARDGHFRRRLEIVMEWLKDERELRVLDYGCGSGVLLAALAQAGHLVTGVDISAGMLESARLNLQGAGVTPRRFRLEQVREDFQGDYLTRSYDVIVSLGVIEYLSRPMNLLAGLADHLEPGGRMVLSFPNQRSILRKIERLVFKHPSVFGKLGIFPHLTTADSYLNFQKHQFTIDEINSFGRSQGLLSGRSVFYVAPAVLRRWQGRPAVGMTAIAEFRKAQS